MSEVTSDTADGALLARVRAGDERALGALYDRYGPRLYALARALVTDPAEAEEVVADAFLRLWRGHDFDPGRGSVGAYLTVVVRSRALDRVRAARRRGAAEERAAEREPSGFAVPVAAPAAAPDAEAERGEARRRILRAMDGLPEPQRVVIDLAYFGGLTHSEIARRLAEPLGTVKTRLRDGMRKLREAMPPMPVSEP